MIDWIHELAREWGHWVRKAEAKQRQISGTLGRIVEEGPDGAAIRSHHDNIPIVDFPEDVAKFHRAWLKLGKDDKLLIEVDYKRRYSVGKKFAAVGKKKDAYYRARSGALASVMYLMGEG